MVLIGYCLCLKPYRLEIIGLILAIFGVACMLSDPSAERTDGKKGTVLAYVICFSMTILAVFYFLINGLLVKTVPIFFLLFAQSALGFFYLTIFFYATGVDPEYEFASVDKDHGAFGFLNEENVLVAMLCFGPSAGFWGSAGIVVSMLFFSPVITSACFLLVPFIS